MHVMVGIVLNNRTIIHRHIESIDSEYSCSHHLGIIVFQNRAIIQCQASSMKCLNDRISCFALVRILNGVLRIDHDIAERKI